MKTNWTPHDKLWFNNLIKKVDNIQFTQINMFCFIEIEHTVQV